MNKSQGILSKSNTFQYEARNKLGQKIIGTIQAKNIVLAKVELRKQNIIFNRIFKKRTRFFDRINKKITTTDIRVFSRQLATMIDSGIALAQSLDIIAKSQTRIGLKQLIEGIKNNVARGLTLAEAMSKQPGLFNKLYCSLVHAGEESGKLQLMLAKIAIHQEKIETIKKKIKKTISYPLAVLAVALLVTVGLLMFVVPQFESLFTGFGAELPTMTKTIVSLSQYCKKYWYLLLIIPAITIYSFMYARRYSGRFAQNIDIMLLKTPGIGSILQKAAIARFSRTLEITFASGLPLIEALKSVADATGNRLFSMATLQITEQVANGQQLNSAMEQTQLFPNQVVQMIAIGEESGALEKMLSKVADWYEEDVNNAVDVLTGLLEPVTMTLLGILVGTLIVAMYLPVFKLGAAI